MNFRNENNDTKNGRNNTNNGKKRFERQMTDGHAQAKKERKAPASNGAYKRPHAPKKASFADAEVGRFHENGTDAHPTKKQTKKNQSVTQSFKGEKTNAFLQKTEEGKGRQGTKKSSNQASARDNAVPSKPARKQKGAEWQSDRDVTGRNSYAPYKKDRHRRTEYAQSTTSDGELAVFKKGAPPLRIIPLGGLGEIGKNITAIECGTDIIVVDCGVAFPDEDMLGVDLVIPDVSYLVENKDRVRGIVITHGHEDHIGAVPYVLRTLNVPVYGTSLTIGILKNKLQEHSLPEKPELRVVAAGDMIQLGMCRVEFVHVNHSIADACAICIETPAGVVFHTGDFKLDVSPIDGHMMDVVRIGEIGRRGVLLMLGESTNAERPGFTPSERKVGGSLETIFAANPQKRLIIATFSSNVHRVQQVIDASVRHGRKVAVLGRSMMNVVGAAVELEYMNVPEGTLIDVSEINRFRPEQITLITTGSQGEPMSALYRMAFSEHDRVKLGADDLVILSSSAIPGNEKLVGKVINALIKSGIRVVNDTVADVHVSGHACSEELKLMLALVKPTYFMPIHGEDRHLFAHKQLAEYMGMAPSNIFIGDNGKVLEISERGARFANAVSAGGIMVDGSGVGDVGSVVLRDRRHLSQDGLIVVVATVDINEQLILSGPDLVSRGFVYVRESEELMEEAKRLAYATLEDALEGGCVGWTELKNAVRDELAKYFYKKTKRRPMILPIVMNV